MVASKNEGPGFKSRLGGSPNYVTKGLRANKICSPLKVYLRVASIMEVDIPAILCKIYSFFFKWQTLVLPPLQDVG